MLMAKLFILCGDNSVFARLVVSRAARREGARNAQRNTIRAMAAVGDRWGGSDGSGGSGVRWEYIGLAGAGHCGDIGRPDSDRRSNGERRAAAGDHDDRCGVLGGLRNRYELREPEHGFGYGGGGAPVAFATVTKLATGYDVPLPAAGDGGGWDVFRKRGSDVPDAGGGVRDGGTGCGGSGGGGAGRD